MALGLEWTGLRQLQSALTFEQVRSWMGILKNVRKMGFASMLAAVITGIYMMITDVGATAWIIFTIGSLALVIALAQVLTAPRMKAIGQTLAADKGQLTAAFRSRISDTVLWISIQTRVAIALGIVFLKIVQPELVGSLLTIGAAIVLGIASALPLHGRKPVQEAPVDRTA